MRCLGCQYDLKNLSTGGEHRCPECGRAFDPRDPSTFGTVYTYREQRRNWLFKSAFWGFISLSWAFICAVQLSKGLSFKSTLYCILAVGFALYFVQIVVSGRPLR